MSLTNTKNSATNNKSSVKLTQSSLLSFNARSKNLLEEKENHLKKSSSSFKRISGGAKERKIKYNVIEEVKPAKFEIPDQYDYGTFMDAIEVIEFAHFLGRRFCTDEKKNTRTDLNLFLEDLGSTYNIKGFPHLYSVARILVLAHIKLQDLCEQLKRQKSSLKYANEWHKFQNCLSYSTFSEFVKIMAHNLTYHPKDSEDKSYSRLLNLPDFFHFTMRDKLKILRRMYHDIINHPVYMREANRMMGEDNQKKTCGIQIVSKCDTNDKACNNSKQVDDVEDEDESQFIFCRQIPLIPITSSILLWCLNSYKGTLIEDTKNKKIFYYDQTHLPDLINYASKLRKPRIANKLIYDLSSKKNGFETQVNGVDIKEVAKRNICLIVYEYVRSGPTYKTMEKKLIHLNQHMACHVLSWVEFFHEFLSNIWNILKKHSKCVLPSNPLSARDNFLSYVLKIKTWSGFCFACQIFINTFTPYRHYRRYIQQISLISDEESQSSSEEEDTNTKCFGCTKLFFVSNNTDSKWLCRGCRYKNRSKLMKPASREEDSNLSSVSHRKINKLSSNRFNFELLENDSSNSHKDLSSARKYRLRSSIRRIVISDSD